MKKDMSKTKFVVELIYGTNVVDIGYDDLKKLKPIMEHSKIYRAPEGFTYKQAVDVINYVFTYAFNITEAQDTNEETAKDMMFQFDHLMETYGFAEEKVDLQTSEDVERLQVFTDNVKFMKRIGVKIEQKDTPLCAYGNMSYLKSSNKIRYNWNNKNIKLSDVRTIYESVGKCDPRVIDIMHHEDRLKYEEAIAEAKRPDID